MIRRAAFEVPGGLFGGSLAPRSAGSARQTLCLFTPLKHSGRTTRAPKIFSATSNQQSVCLEARKRSSGIKPGHPANCILASRATAPNTVDNILSNANGYQSTVRRVTVAGAHDALMIIREAASWAAARGIDVWAAHELRKEAFEEAARKSELVIGYADATPAATMLLQPEDLLYWPEEAPASALYLHKIAIRRAFAGQSWLSRLIDFAIEDATANGIPRLRLDTIFRPKLQSIYEHHGFRVLPEKPRMVAGRQMIRMERILGSGAAGND